jgi:hypothetical protein
MYVAGRGRGRGDGDGARQHTWGQGDQYEPRGV